MVGAELPGKPDIFSVPREAPNLLQCNDPLVDIETYKDIGRVVKKVRYSPFKYNAPKGLGRWKAETFYAEALPESPLTWIEQPSNGGYLTLKTQGLKTFFDVSLDSERAVLVKTNGLFLPTDDARPVRIFGYGMEEESSGFYLITESIPESYVELSKYIAQKGRLPAVEAVDMGTKLFGMLDRLHSSRVLHGDLEERHVFWNPRLGRARVVDWGSADDYSLIRPGVSLRAGWLSMDRNEVAKIMYKALTGLPLGQNFRREFFESYNGPKREELFIFIINSLGLRTDRQIINLRTTRQLAKYLETIKQGLPSFR